MFKFGLQHVKGHMPITNTSIHQIELIVKESFNLSSQIFFLNIILNSNILLRSTL